MKEEKEEEEQRSIIDTVMLGGFVAGAVYLLVTYSDVNLGNLAINLVINLGVN